MLRLVGKQCRKSCLFEGIRSDILSKIICILDDLGRLLENMVFLELLKRGYDLKKHELFYYRSRNDREVDFVCRKGVTIRQLIQVCYDISSPKTREREIRSLVECAEELNVNKLLIITWDQDKTIEKGGYTIEVISVKNWAGKFCL